MDSVAINWNVLQNASNGNSYKTQFETEYSGKCYRVTVVWYHDGWGRTIANFELRIFVLGAGPTYWQTEETIEERDQLIEDHPQVAARVWAEEKFLSPMARLAAQLGKRR